MKEFDPITMLDYGKLKSYVDLKPDFFSGFQPDHRDSIISAEAEFYRKLTTPYSVDSQIEKYYLDIPSFDGASIRIKVYRPLQSDSPLPALLFMHGGGFITCSVETHDFVPSYIAAKSGILVISVEYRLAPEHKFPTGLFDCYAALEWIHSHASQLGIIPNEISVGGDSSGGNFAIGLTLLASERQSVPISKQVLIYPATDLSGTIQMKSKEVYAMPGSNTEVSGVDFLTAYTSIEDDLCNPLISPLHAENFADLPPTLFILAECDALVDDGLYYAKQLKNAGVSVDYFIYEGMPHAFILRTYPETFAALDEISRFLGK